jgi:hypothetical protein
MTRPELEAKLKELREGLVVNGEYSVIEDNYNREQTDRADQSNNPCESEDKNIKHIKSFLDKRYYLTIMGCQESNKMKSQKLVIDLDQELDFLNRFAWRYQQQIKSFEQSERLDRFIQKRYNYLYTKRALDKQRFLINF